MHLEECILITTDLHPGVHMYNVYNEDWTEAAICSILTVNSGGGVGVGTPCAHMVAWGRRRGSQAGLAQAREPLRTPCRGGKPLALPWTYE